LDFSKVGPTANAQLVLSDARPRPTTIVISAMGGQGGGVLSSWIVNVAEQCGFIAQATSVPGVAQRTGTTIYYIELFPTAAADQAGRVPVLALMPVRGEVDVLLAAELIEAGRAVTRGFVSPDRTTVIASSHREYSVAEKMHIGDGIADRAQVLASVEEAARDCVSFDMSALATSSNSHISSVMFGALAGVGCLPFERKAYEAAIGRGGIAVESNLVGFAAGFERAHNGASAVARAETTGAPEVVHRTPRARALSDRISATVPEDARPIVVEGVRRMADYQDMRYAEAYLDRLVPVVAADTGGSDGTHRLLTETARHLALWMSYEDAIRVADLKTRSERFERFRGEVGAQPGQLVYVVEYLHPRVEEVCDILPAPMGRFVMQRSGLRNLVDKMISRGRQVPTAKLRGFLLLHVMAGLRRWRRSTYRYCRELQLIDGWCARILVAAAVDYDLAVEIAKCQRLIKGYGDTHARGMRAFDTVIEALERDDLGEHPADTARKLIDAAMADEDGAALESALRNLR
jgi:indolepyruvate ferredoxin oxidoreductase beta subunit